MKMTAGNDQVTINSQSKPDFAGRKYETAGFYSIRGGHRRFRHMKHNKNWLGNKKVWHWKTRNRIEYL